MNEKDLVEAAIRARENAYAPYSHFKVGAALLTEDKEVFFGCNIENAAYSVTNCAERTAFFHAISQGKRSFHAIAIVGGKEGESALSLCSPCGVCRQVMAEFCSPDFQIIFGMRDEEGNLFWETHCLEELLPYHFDLNNL